MAANPQEPAPSLVQLLEGRAEEWDALYEKSISQGNRVATLAKAGAFREAAQLARDHIPPEVEEARVEVPPTAEEVRGIFKPDWEPLSVREARREIAEWESRAPASPESRGEDARGDRVVELVEAARAYRETMENNWASGDDYARGISVGDWDEEREQAAADRLDAALAHFPTEQQADAPAPNVASTKEEEK